MDIIFQKEFYRFIQKDLTSNERELILTEMQEALRGNNKFKNDEDKYLNLNQLNKDELMGELDRILTDTIKRYEFENLGITLDEEKEENILDSEEFKNTLKIVESFRR